MGTVWAARHTVTQRPVALKFLRRHGSEHVRRFLREARIVGALEHPNVVRIYDVLHTDDGSPVMVMDRLFGESLGKKLAREKSISGPELARVVRAVCDVLGTVHARGIVHRDLKPENIFLAEDGVKVLDFGIAKLTVQSDTAHSGSLTSTGSLMGTPYYMAPEQVFGEKAMDHRADIWALGIILYECLAGHRPIEGENVGQILKGITMGEIAPLARARPDLPAATAALVTRMLARNPDERPSLEEVVRVFDGGAARISRHPRAKGKFYLGIAAAGGMAICGAFLSQHHRPAASAPPAVTPATSAGESAGPPPPAASISSEAAHSSSGPRPDSEPPAPSAVPVETPVVSRPHPLPAKRSLAAPPPTVHADAGPAPARLPGGVYGESPYH